MNQLSLGFLVTRRRRCIESPKCFNLIKKLGCRLSVRILLIFPKFTQLCVDNDDVDRFYSCRSRDGDNILLNHKIFDTNKNIRHRQRDNILCPCHQCLLHSTSPTIPMFGFSFRRDFYLFAIINNSFNRLGSIKNCAKNISSQ